MFQPLIFRGVFIVRFDSRVILQSSRWFSLWFPDRLVPFQTLGFPSHLLSSDPLQLFQKSSIFFHSCRRGRWHDNVSQRFQGTMLYPSFYATAIYPEINQSVILLMFLLALVYWELHFLIDNIWCYSYSTRICNVSDCLNPDMLRTRS